MKLNYYFSIVFLLCAHFFFSPASSAQNIVANPSFEIYNACPDNSFVNLSYDFPPLSQPTVQNWFFANEATTDYYNACATPAPPFMLGVPNNWVGHQYPRTGQGMAGGIFYVKYPATTPAGITYAEYLQGTLVTPMIAGHVYYGSYWVSLSENDQIFQVNSFDVIGIDKLGAHFSTTAIVESGYSILNLNADISSPAGVFYTDTAIWKKVEGFYTAAGGEAWITIGAFTPYANQSSILVDTDFLDVPTAYYFIDDVCVYDLSAGDHINAHDTIVCNGGATLNISGKANAASWIWNTGATTQSVNVSDGTYWVQSIGECEAWVDTFHVVINSIELGNDTLVCGNQPIIIGPAPNAARSYLWNTGVATSQITVDTAGLYILTVTAAGCPPIEDSIKVTYAPKPPRLPDYDTLICTSQGGIFQIPVTGNGLIWHSMPDDEGSSQAPVIDKSNYGSFVFYVQQSDSCYSDLSEVKINVLPKPYVQLDDTTICNAGDPVILLGQEQSFVDFAWNTGANTCCISVNQSGIYNLTVSNECGVAKGESEVVITDCDSCLKVPNAFSPNGDALNDEFKPMYACAYHSFALSIYNRFGQRVFFSNNSKKGWDGTFNGKPCDIGTYFFYIEETLLYPDGEKITLKGDFELLR